MTRALVILLICAVLAWVVRRVWVAVLQLRVGAIPDDVDVPVVPLDEGRGWQVTRTVASGVATVRVEHPSEGVAREWTLQLRDPGAADRLDETMRRAGTLRAQLDG